ncbi:hypothetical protein Mal4_04580 [Maioricimonas rarisocia]|uniref:DUF4174 domain-containing protein n=2 Tax=Maioricimonas rarisocia TaxID=2528026 RepID=A0A517Z120_9PLAN|nr:hypothetical protein Mal4_04580 [Maioricimonas rarisocia]
MLAVVAVLAVSATASAEGLEFDSYTKAYWKAKELARPMLVILNPSAGEVSSEPIVAMEELRGDLKLSVLLNDYVVAVVDTGTEHGRKVHELFGAPELPRVVVIDERQEKQVYRTSETLTTAELRTVLTKYRDGVPESKPVHVNWSQPYRQPGYCPSCQRR